MQTTTPKIISIGTTQKVTIGQTIRAKRIAYKWSQKTLSTLSGLTQAQISRVEGGANTRLTTLFMICDALDLDFTVFGASMKGERKKLLSFLGIKEEINKYLNK